MTYYVGCMPVGNHLAHHGILGMRWGKKNGPPYPLGYSAHSAKEKKLNPKKRISAGDPSSSKKVKAKKQKKSVWDKWDELSDEKKKRIKKAALIGAAATVAGIAAYSGAHRYIQENVGHTIKAGKKMQTIGNAAKDFSRSFYTTDRAVDKMKYKGYYGVQRKATAGMRPGVSSDVYKHVLKATKDIKIAPNKVAYSEFEKLYKTDKNFRASVLKSVDGFDALAIFNPQYRKFFGTSSKLAGGSNIDKKTLRKAYDMVNIANAMHDKSSASVMSTLSKSLKNKGYGGIYDINDLRYSGYKSKGAVVLFDQSPIVEDQVRKMKNGEIAINYLGADLVKNSPLYGATTAAIGYRSYKKHQKRKGKSK